MEAKKDKSKIIFAIFAAIVISITVFNIYLDRKIDSGEDVERLKKENNELRAENVGMEEKLLSVTPSSQESERKDYIQLAEKFINLTMFQEKEGYEERRNQAEKIMSKDLFELFYPTETFQYEESYSSKPSDVSIYLRSHQALENEIILLAEYKVNLLTKEKSEPETTNNVVKLTVNKQEGKWIVTSIDEISIGII
ncbi:hypothetical protein [Bacillus sp. FJAT-27231]|uniref:hypothetical protein n=1 Tax=Bacillus sp. FJAT-27231 TaxID=1679168 RepID=UPI0006710468|nr:hypothetical protein [Bacillus sp. FJAT-27231]